MCCCYNPLVVVRSPTGPQHPHHQLSWTTPTNGKSIGSWTVGSIIGTKDGACFTWSSGKDLTTPPMRQVGSHLNTWRMHLMWLEHSTRLIHISQPPKFMNVKNTAQIVVQCSGRNTQCYNKITTCTNSSYVKVIMSLMKDKSSMKYSLQCSGRNAEAESETNC